MTKRQTGRQMRWLLGILTLPLIFLPTGCHKPSDYRTKADDVAAQIIEEKQKQTLGKTQELSVERPSDILRRRLFADQNLPYSSEASLGTDQLKPVKHWPEPNYPQAVLSGSNKDIVIEPNTPVRLSLFQALQVGASNSFDYQSRKETVFQAALDLDLQRYVFRNTFTGQLESLLSTDTTRDPTVSSLDSSGSASLTRRLESGAQLTTALAVDLANLLTQNGASALGLSADATISIPLLRGAGRYIVLESLTQAERNMVYSIYDFERFKRTLALNIARSYFATLQQMDQVTNAQENYRSAVRSARWSRRRGDAGRLRQTEVDQAFQRELTSRNSWISAQERLKGNLDSLKNTLGLPPDAQIELDPNDLEELRARGKDLVEELSQAPETESPQEVPPADSPVELKPPTNEDAGLWEIDESLAMHLALANRLDLRVAIARVNDAQRQVVVRADAFKAGLNLTGTARLSGNDNDGGLSFQGGRYSGLLSLDLPIDRTRQQADYRNSLISLEKAVRSVQSLEDSIKVAIRNELRTLLQSRESLKIQAQSVIVAEKRVKSSNMFFEAGKIQIRDLLDAQDALLSAQNSLTSAVVSYQTAELELQRDMEVLEIDEKGLWRQMSPEEIKNGKK